VDYSFPELGSEAGAGEVGVVETSAAARWTFWELLVAKAGHSLLKWSADPQ
jgi:hypothetical protein